MKAGIWAAWLACRRGWHWYGPAASLSFSVQSSPGASVFPRRINSDLARCNIDGRMTALRALVHMGQGLLMLPTSTNHIMNVEFPQRAVALMDCELDIVRLRPSQKPYSALPWFRPIRTTIFPITRPNFIFIAVQFHFVLSQHTTRPGALLISRRAFLPLPLTLPNCQDSYTTNSSNTNFLKRTTTFN